MSKNFTGVWIDMKKAVIIDILDESTNVRVLESEIEPRERFPGESNQAGRFGSQSASDERSKKLRIEHDTKMFLKQIVDTLTYTAPVVVFGPAEMKKKLRKELMNHTVLKDHVMGVETADKMTEKQMVAWVKDYFKLT